MTYCEKYCHLNGGTRFIYDDIYKNIIAKQIGMRSNMLASCGENLEAYLDYAEVVCSTPNARAIFMENHIPRYKRLKKHLSNSKRKIARKVRLIPGNILVYDDIKKRSKVKLPVKTRVEDFGFGIKFERMVRFMIPQLDRQRNQDAWAGMRILPRAQIFDGSLKFVSVDSRIKLLNQYLDVIGTHLISINGISVNGKENPFNYGEKVWNYSDKKLPKHKLLSVRKHTTELADNWRHPIMYMYTSKNGTPMLTCLLIYDLNRNK